MIYFMLICESNWMWLKVDTLEEFYVEASALAYDRQQAETFVFCICIFFTFAANSSGVSSGKERPGEIVKRVQDLFNKKYIK